MNTNEDYGVTNQRLNDNNDVHFTCFVRLPFRRGDFVDPPLVDWDNWKDRELWKILSNNTRSTDLDWRALADRFDVSLPFILQQAAWLYERQLSQVRAQMRKVGRSNAPSPALGVGSFPGSQPMQRQISGEGGSRLSAHTASITRHHSLRGSTAEGSAPATPKAKEPSISRNMSNATVTQSHLMGHRSPHQRPTDPHEQQSPPPKLQSLQRDKNVDFKGETERSPSPTSGDTTSSSSSESETEETAVRASQTFRRTARFMPGKRPLIRNAPSEDSVNENEEEEVDSPTFLPFSDVAGAAPSDLGATIRGEIPGQPDDKQSGSKQASVKRIPTTDSSTSSASSAAVVPNIGTTADGQRRQASFSPQQRAEIAQLNARRRAAKKEGSEGTPSMGSSFSDLDNTSVTQSALEEALLSNMGQGSAAGSRISNISQALKSKYL